MNDELFELCKSVYEKTKWGINYSPPAEIEGRHFNESIDCELAFAWQDKKFVDGEIFDSFNIDGTVPLYTSDYLLDKLPKYQDKHWLAVAPIASETWSASYIKRFDSEIKHDNWADTPLKALLKLTLALADAGELPTEAN